MAGRRRTRRRKQRKQRGGSLLQARFNTAAIQGQTLPLEATENEPLLEWPAPPLDTYVTLICYDPNAIAPAWLHWLVVNCVGTSPNSGDTLLEWAPPAPPPNTGKHEYKIQLFKHTYKIPVDVAPTQRGYFNVREFAEKNRLEPMAKTSFFVKAPA